MRLLRLKKARNDEILNKEEIASSEKRLAMTKSNANNKTQNTKPQTTKHHAHFRRISYFNH